MAVYYKFKSEIEYKSITIDSQYISVLQLKNRVFETNHYGKGRRGKCFDDLIVINAQTNQEYCDDPMLIAKNTSLLLRRVPRLLCLPIVIQSSEPMVEIKVDDQLAKSNSLRADSSVSNNYEASDYDDEEFGGDIYATIPEVPPRQPITVMHDSTFLSKPDEDSKIKAVTESSCLDWQRETANGFVQGRAFGSGGVGGGGRGFGQGCGLPQKTPPQGYICHRCKIPGHFIQHCPTNGDPNFDIRKAKPSTGIPKSMLVPTPDGLYALSSGASAVLKPNEAAFEKELEGLTLTRSTLDLPPELHCPLCNEVMKDAVFTSRCCYKSFCDKCIRDLIISKSVCFCEAKNVLADDLLPNMTVRDTINRILESGNSSSQNGLSSIHFQDSESGRSLPPNNPSPMQFATSKEEKFPSKVEEFQNVKESVDGTTTIPQSPRVPTNSKVIQDVSEATSESTRVKKNVSQTGAVPVAEAQQKLAGDGAGKRKKMKTVSSPPNGADMRGLQLHLGPHGYVHPSSFNPYCQGYPPTDGHVVPFVNNMPFNMVYHQGQYHANVVPWEQAPPIKPHYVIHPQMIPHPQRDLAAEFHRGTNVRPPLPTREEFDARRVVTNRNGEMEGQFENRELPMDRNFRDRSSSVNLSTMKSKPKASPVRRSPSLDCQEIDRGRKWVRGHGLDSRRESERSREKYSPDQKRDRQRDLDQESHHRRSSGSRLPDRSALEHCDKNLRSSLKRKAEHCDFDHDKNRFKEHGREREHDRDNQRRQRSESKPPAGPKPDSKSICKAYEASGSGSGYYHHKETVTPSSVSTELLRKSVTAVTDYESSDDERHFKRRRRSKYEPQPLPREEWMYAGEDKGKMLHSRLVMC